eukprot:6208710-Pleurochrysis_carterae.AAC.1
MLEEARLKAEELKDKILREAQAEAAKTLSNAVAKAKETTPHQSDRDLVDRTVPPKRKGKSNLLTTSKYAMQKAPMPTPKERASAFTSKSTITPSVSPEQPQVTEAKQNESDDDNNDNDSNSDLSSESSSGSSSVSSDDNDDEDSGSNDDDDESHDDDNDGASAPATAEIVSDDNDDGQSNIEEGSLVGGCGSGKTKISLMRVAIARTGTVLLTVLQTMMMMI